MIRFPNISPKSIIDTLIGIDYVNLHCVEIKINREPNTPVA